MNVKIVHGGLYGVDADGNLVRVNVSESGAVGVAQATQVPLGYQQITNLSVSTALTVPSGATMALIESDTTAVHWRDDGVAPTATVGMNLAAGELLEYTGDLSAIRFIQSGVGAILNVSYYR